MTDPDEFVLHYLPGEEITDATIAWVYLPGFGMTAGTPDKFQGRAIIVRLPRPKSEMLAENYVPAPKEN